MKKMLKLFSVALSASMLVNTASVSAMMILPKEDNVVEAGAVLPVKGATLYKPVIPTEKTLITGENSALQIVDVNNDKGGAVYAENGKIVINRETTDATNGFKMWINNDKSVINDKPVAVSFDVQKSTALDRVEFRMISSLSSSQLHSVVLNDYMQPIISAQEKTGTNNYITDNSVEIDSVTSPVTVTMMYNPFEKACSAWITYKVEGVEKTMLLCSGAMARENTADVFGLHVYSERGRECGPISISNIEFWEATPTATDKANYIANDINLGVTSTIFDFELPQTVGEYPITWSSSHPEIIAINGSNAAVTAPTDKETTVTLTGAITVNGAIGYKKFNVTVAKDNRPPMAEETEYIFYEDFNYTAENTPVAEKGKRITLPNSGGLFSGGCFYINEDGSHSWGSLASSNSVPVIENGKLVLSDKDANLEDYAMIWLSEDGRGNLLESIGENRIAVDYEIETSNTSAKFHASLNRGTHRQSVFVHSDMRLGTATSSGLWINNASSSTWIGRVPESKVRYTAVFNKDGNTFDLYKNGVQVADDFVRKSTDATLGSLCVWMDKGDNATIYIDNIKVYYVSESAQERVNAEFAKLEAGGFSAINSTEQTLVEADFAYAPADEEIQVKFSSDVEGLVNSNGTINRKAATAEVTEAEVTVTLSLNGFEKSISYKAAIANEVVIKKAEGSEWEGNYYFAIYPAYTIGEGSYYCDVILKAYDIKSGELVAESTTENVVMPYDPDPEQYEANMIYGEITLDSDKNDSNTRIEVEIELLTENAYIESENISGSWDGNTYTAKVPVYATTDAEESVWLIVAGYKEGRLVKCSMENVIIPEKIPGGETTISGTLTVEGGADACPVVEVFAWKDMDTLIPVASR